MRMLPGSYRHFVTVVGVGLLAGPLSGCADSNTAPASQRGFFGGMGAMVSGSDERRAAGMESDAAAAEARSRQLAARADAAQRDAAITSGQVRASERRLANIRGDVQRQRERLAAARANATSPPVAAEAARIQNEIDAIEREQRSAAASVSTLSPATLQRLEDRTRDVSRALDRLGTI
jgi:hypothetical protein